MMQKKDIRRWSYKWGALFIFGVFPYVVILLFQLFQKPEWVGRLVALSIVFSMSIPTIFWYALSPKTEIIKKGALFDKPGYEKIKKITNQLIRLIFIVFAIGLLFFIVVPFSTDIISIHRDSLMRIQGKITRNSSPFGAWFLSQSIRLDGEKDAKRNLFLIYSFAPPLRRGDNYELLILEQSRLILEVREIKK